MKAWLMDAYRSRNSVVLWIKTPEEELRIEKAFSTNIYLDIAAKKILDKNKVPYLVVKRQNYLRKWLEVCSLQIPELSSFERFISWLEKKTKHQIPFYNADIAPEQSYLYRHNLIPCTAVELNGETIIPVQDDLCPELKKIDIVVIPDGNLNDGTPVRAIVVNDAELKGEEENLLREFAEEFIRQDPDVVLMQYAFSRLPYLVKRLQLYNIHCPFHRWDEQPLLYKGGKSFFSYGKVRYQDFAIRLHGRFLVDSSTTVGDYCGIDSIVELCQLSGTLFQRVASRSFGAVFQSALVRQMVRNNLLVPFKEKPIDKPLNMFQLLKSDRAGHTFDPKVGFHKNVAEIDFCSMFPWLIYNHNISADTILCKEGPFEKVPGIPIKASLKHKGLVPLAIKPFLDRRMEYKRNPTALNRVRAVGLKWVLVTSYGYLRFREFKLGLATSHMAICAYARETIIKAARLAEERGFEIVHGIIDSLYLKKKDISEEEVKSFCKELEAITGIPVSFEGIFKWAVFLPSVNDAERPVPTCYYGVFRDGTIKARGIEVRQRQVPLIVKYFQKKVLEQMSYCSNKKEIISKVPLFCRLLRKVLERIPQLESKWLSCSMYISRTDYKNNISQKKALLRLKKRGVTVMPGQLVRFVHAKRKVILPEEYTGNPDVEHYRKLLVRALFVVLQPFGFTRDAIMEFSGFERQTRLEDFDHEYITHVYIPISRSYESRKGLAEKQLRKRLERQGWLVWRGGLVGIVRQLEVYPNVRRKYEQLCSLIDKHHPGVLEHLQYICDVHHGMPDFLCFRKGTFKFVECKLGHEQLSSGQKRCIQKLRELSFDVEVHKLVDACTKTRIAMVDLEKGEKRVLEKQMSLVKL